MNKKNFSYAVATMLLAVCAFGCKGQNEPEQGANSKFSVSETQQVEFAKGNLQYQPSTRTWRFAENQWDIVGEDNKNISDTYTGWIDLFGFGTGDAPTKVSQSTADYVTFTDWGVNKISNGGNKANVWRTLTSDEWEYLFHGRKNADKLFGLGKVNNVYGCVILPDSWKLPAGLEFTPSTTKGLAWNGHVYQNPNGGNFSHNTYSLDQWQQMEKAGAVFLPSCGFRVGTKLGDIGYFGHYHSSTGKYGTHIVSLYFCAIYTAPKNYYDNFYANGVRLVK